MTAYLFGSWIVICILATVQFRRSAIYSGAVLGQTSVIVGLWAVWVALENQFTPTRVDVFIPWPIPESALWAMLKVIVVFVVSFFLGQLLFARFMGVKVKGKRLVPFPPLGQKNISIPKKKLFDISFFATVILVLLTAEGWWIFAPYPESKRIWAVFTFVPQSNVIAVAGALLALHAGLVCGGGRKVMSVLLVCGLISHSMLSGDRGSMLILMAGVFGIVYYQSSSRRRRWLICGALTIIYPLFTLMSNISQWRGSLRTGRGLEWVWESSFLGWVESIPNIWKTIPDTYRAAELFTLYGGYFEDNFPYFIFILIRQIVPGRILETMGMELYNGPWALGEFFRHGGGFYPPAEMFFLNGYVAVVTLSFYFGALAAVLDRVWRTSIAFGLKNMVGNPVFLLTVLATIAMPRTLYGLQTWHRLITTPIVFLVLLQIWRLSLKKRLMPQKRKAKHGLM